MIGLNSGMLLNAGTELLSHKSVDINVNSASIEDNIHRKFGKLDKLTKDQLWNKAYSMHYKGPKGDIQEVIYLYRYICVNYPASDEAGYAKNQLIILNTDIDTDSSSNSIPVKRNDLIDSSSYNGHYSSDPPPSSVGLNILSAAIIIMFISIIILSNSGDQLGSQAYKGNIEAFADDAQKRAGYISVLIVSLVPCIGLWVGWAIFRNRGR